MKIGLVCPYNIFLGGGVQECVFALQKELLMRGHNAWIITPRPRDYTKPAPKNMILIGAGTEIKSPFYTTAQVSVSVEPDEVDSMLQSHKFDVLHFHEPWVPILSRQILAHSQAANVATFHAKLPGTIMSRTFERVITPYTKSVLKFLHELTAVSDIAAEYVQFLAHTKPAIIPNGVDLAQYSSKPRITTNKLKTVLYIGRLERRKGLKYLLKAFALLSTNDKSTQLIVAGEGPDRPKLAQYVQDNRIPRVHFKGFVSEQEKLDLLKNADLFCSPALFGESFGIVLLEAMARGCVIVAGDNVGYKSVLKETGRLSIVNPKHSQEFASRLELLLTDEALRKAWFDWANTYVRQFAFERITDQYETIYKAAIKQLQ